MEAVPSAAAAAAIAPASARRSWRGGFALRDGRSAAGGRGCGWASTGSGTRVSTSRYAVDDVASVRTRVREQNRDATYPW